jgi:VWFA-related protein
MPPSIGARPRALATVTVAVLMAWTLAARSQAPAAPAPPAQTPQPQTPQPPPTFRGGADLVLVDVYPQRDGRIVEGLTAADFEVYEDGRRQPIDQFEFVRVASARFDAPRQDPASIAESWAAAADPHSRVFVAFLDQGHTTLEGAALIRRPLVEMLDRAMGHDDLFGVVTESMRPEDLTLARRLETIDQQLARYWTWAERQRPSGIGADPVESMLFTCFHGRWTDTGFQDWLVKDGSAMRPLDEVLIDRRREERTLGRLRDLVSYLGGRREARTVVIAITDGWRLFSPDVSLENQPSRDPRTAGGGIPTAPIGPRPGDAGTTNRTTGGAEGGTAPACTSELNRLAEYDGARLLQDVFTLAARSNVSMYPVASGGLAVFDTSLSELVRSPTPGAMAAGDAGRVTARVESLRTLAESTGGIAFVNGNDLTGGLRRIADDVSAYYLLGYASPAAGRRDGYHRIEVKLKQPGLQVRARRGYTARPADAAPRGASATPDVGSAPAVAAVEALSRVPEATSLFIRARAAGGDLAVVAELATRVSDLADWRDGGRVAVTVTTDAGTRVGEAAGVIAPGARAALMHVPADGSGPWQVTVRVEARGASFQDSVRVAADALALAEPIAFRGPPSLRIAPRPAADAEFRRTERLHLELAAAAGTRAAAARLLDRRGQPLALPVAVAVADRGNQATVTVDLPLGALAAGDYVVEITTTAGQRVFAFRVTP